MASPVGQQHPVAAKHCCLPQKVQLGLMKFWFRLGVMLVDRPRPKMRDCLFSCFGIPADCMHPILVTPTVEPVQVAAVAAVAVAVVASTSRRQIPTTVTSRVPWARAAQVIESVPPSRYWMRLRPNTITNTTTSDNVVHVQRRVIDINNMPTPPGYIRPTVGGRRF